MFAFSDITHPLWHPAFEVAGFVTAGILYRRGRRQRGDLLAEDVRFGIIVAAILGAAIGSKLLHHISSPAEVLAVLQDRGWSGLALHMMGGKTIVGGLLGGWLAVEWAKRRYGVRSRTGDLFVTPLLWGTLVGRLGCLLAGPGDDTLGIVTQSFWGVDFGDGQLRFPTPAFEIAFLGIFGLVLRRRYRLGSFSRPNGEAFRMFLGGYLGFRLVIDSFKPYEHLLGLGGIQWACLGGLVILGSSRFRNSEPSVPNATSPLDQNQP